MLLVLYAAPSTAPMLVLGPSGVGINPEMHDSAPRRDVMKVSGTKLSNRFLFNWDGLRSAV